MGGGGGGGTYTFCTEEISFCFVVLKRESLMRVCVRAVHVVFAEGMCTCSHMVFGEVLCRHVSCHL